MTRAKPGDSLSLRRDDPPAPTTVNRPDAWVATPSAGAPDARDVAPTANRPDAGVATPSAGAPDDAGDVAPLPQRIGKRIAPYLYLFSTVIFAGALALDPVGRIFIAPLVLLLVVVAGLFLATIVVARTELRALVVNRRVRVIHGLEHACVAILQERGFRPIQGRTQEGSFTLVVGDDTPSAAVRQATREAIDRFARGDTRTAYSPHCGTSLLVGITMFALIVVGCAIAAIVFGVPAGSAFMAAAVLGVAAQVAWRPLGLLAQRTLTVSTRFARATVGRVTRTQDERGRRTFDVPCAVTL
jgi:hypothetical protein